MVKPKLIVHTMSYADAAAWLLKVGCSCCGFMWESSKDYKENPYHVLFNSMQLVCDRCWKATEDIRKAEKKRRHWK